MNNPVRLILLVTLAVMLGGCATTQPPAYYLLEPVPDAGVPDDSWQPCMTIGMRPVRIPAYIDRPQIMVRTGRNELAISEFNQWAEPLDENIARVVSQNLEALTCAEVVDLLPAGRSGAADYTLGIRIARLEGSLGGEAVLESAWSLVDTKCREIAASGSSRSTRQVPTGDYASLVSAHSELIAELSREIARSVASLRPDSPRQ